MLGVFLAPDGNNRRQKKYLKKKMNKLGEYIRTGHVNRKEAWISLNLIAMKSLEYALPAMTFTESECNELMWPLLKEFLPKSGINRHVKRDVLYATYNAQGLGVKNPYVIQGVAHIVDITDHLWKKTVTGHMIRVTLEHLIIELGENIEILNKDWKNTRNKY